MAAFQLYLLRGGVGGKGSQRGIIVFVLAENGGHAVRRHSPLLAAPMAISFFLFIVVVIIVVFVIIVIVVQGTAGSGKKILVNRGPVLLQWRPQSPTNTYHTITNDTHGYLALLRISLPQVQTSHLCLSVISGGKEKPFSLGFSYFSFSFAIFSLK